jgi:hypothetical protein
MRRRGAARDLADVRRSGRWRKAFVSRWTALPAGAARRPGLSAASLGGQRPRPGASCWEAPRPDRPDGLSSVGASMHTTTEVPRALGDRAVRPLAPRTPDAPPPTTYMAAQARGRERRLGARSRLSARPGDAVVIAMLVPRRSTERTNPARIANELRRERQRRVAEAAEAAMPNCLMRTPRVVGVPAGPTDSW